MSKNEKQAERARKDAITSHATYGSGPAGGPNLEQQVERLGAALTREGVPLKPKWTALEKQAFGNAGRGHVLDLIEKFEAANVNLALHRAGKLDAYGRERA